MSQRAQIEAWLTEAEIEFVPAEIGEDPRSLWALVVRGRPYNTFVSQRTRPIAGVWMEVQIGVSDDHRETLRQLSPDDRDRFVLDLKIALFGRPVGFNLATSEADAIPSAVVLGLTMLEDPLTRAGFFRRHHQLQTSALLAATMFQKVHRFREWR